MRKGIILVLAVLAMVLPLFAGGTGESVDDGVTMIGISKLMSHPALDAAEQGCIEYLESTGLPVEFQLQNANGDVSTAASIAQLFDTEGMDLVIGIATPTAQALANVFTDIPVVFSSVTDVPAAGLDGIANVCGVSDVVPFQEHLDLIERLTGARRIGMVYTSGEANGISLMEGMKRTAEENGVELIAVSVTNSAEVRTAAASIIDRVDAMYVATDNTVVSALPALSDVCSDASVPLFSADTTSAFGTDVLVAGGFDYYDSGRLTGEIVERILSGESPEDIGTVYLTALELYINLTVAERLGITIPDDMLSDAAYIIEEDIPNNY